MRVRFKSSYLVVFLLNGSKLLCKLFHLGVHSLNFTRSLSMEAHLSCSLLCSLLCIRDLESFVCGYDCEECLFQVKADGFCASYPLRVSFTAEQDSVLLNVDLTAVFSVTIQPHGFVYHPCAAISVW